MAGLLIGCVVALSLLNNPVSDGSQLIYTGAVLNVIAVVSNGGLMPVYDPYITAEELYSRDIFHRHVLGTAKSNFKLLTDWIVVGRGVFSPGDLLMMFGAFMNYFGIDLSVQGSTLSFEYEF